MRPSVQGLKSADVPLAAGVRKVDVAFRGWNPSPANAVVSFTWSAYLKLMLDYNVISEWPASTDDAVT